MLRGPRTIDETRQVTPCIHTKNLVFGLEQARTMLRQVYKQMHEVFYPKTENQNGNEDPQTYHRILRNLRWP